eukprot:COSAG03_NODE_364_length_8537_cov_5.229557_2_plen_123_part_00
MDIATAIAARHDALCNLQRVRDYEPDWRDYVPEPCPRQIGVASETAYVENWTVENVDGWLTDTVGTARNSVKDLRINGLTMVLMPPRPLHDTVLKRYRVARDPNPGFGSLQCTAATCDCKSV